MQTYTRKGVNKPATISLQHICFFACARMRTLPLAKYTEPLSLYNQSV